MTTRARTARAAARSPKPLQKLLQSGQGKVFPAWQACVSRRGQVLFHGAGGQIPGVKKNGHGIDETSVFDLASLTKALVTASSCLPLVAQDRLPLDVPVAEILRRPVRGGDAITARRLLTHCSGLPAWRPFFHEIAGESFDERRARILSAACDTPLLAPPGTQAVYSDVGFLVLTAVVEAIAGERIDRLFTRLHQPRGLFFRPLPAAIADRRTAAYVPTEIDPTRGLLAGQVNDENAWAMGGVSGHAGLFGTADAVRQHVERLVDAWHGRSSLAPQRFARLFWTRANDPPGSTWALGWDTPSRTGSSAGSSPPKGAVGHTGFTGTSVWVDPDREIVAVLLTNRTWPDRTGSAIRAFRPRFHELAWELAG